jgi:hypothetical protein
MLISDRVLLFLPSLTPVNVALTLLTSITESLGSNVDRNILYSLFSSVFPCELCGSFSEAKTTF